VRFFGDFMLFIALGDRKISESWSGPGPFLILML
jgi:hypothetical protein